MERICGRCGVRFDAVGLAPEATCQDCQDVTGERFPNVWRISEVGVRVHPGAIGLAVPEWAEQERIRQINYLTHAYPRSAREIGEMLGINPKTVQRYRKRLDEPADHMRLTMRGVIRRDARRRLNA